MHWNTFSVFSRAPSLFLLCITALKISIILVFSDSDWATHKDDRMSTLGFCFKLSRSCGVVSWASKKQGCVALSSCEVEYVSLALAAQEAVYLQGLLLFFRLMTVDTPVLLCGDNHSHWPATL